MEGYGFSEHENQGAALTTVGLVMDFFCLRKKENGNLKKFENRSLGPDALICVFEKGPLQSMAWPPDAYFILRPHLLRNTIKEALFDCSFVP